MNILLIIVIIILVYLLYFLYKQKEECKIDPTCYLNKTFGILGTCGFNPLCYLDKIKD